MSTTGGDRGGHGLRARRARRDPQEARQRRHRLRPRGRRGEDKAGITNLIDILAVARGIDPATVETRVRGRRLRRLQGGGRRGGGRVPGAGARALRRAAARRGGARARPRRRRREGARDRRRRPLAEVRERDGHRPAGVKLERMTVAELDLDLDVFAGPFDLLLAVVLREEVDLLEVELGEVVVAYVEHLEREGELELEVATEFLVLIASLLELKSRLLLPGADDGLEELGPEEAVEELLARLLEYRRYRDAAAALVERFEAAARLPLPLGAAAAGAAPGRARRRHRRLRPRPARRRARRPADVPPPKSTSATSARPSRWSGACDALREALCRPRQHRLRRAVRRRGPAHPGGHPLRPARALPQRRGDLEAERAASARSRSAEASERRVSDLDRATIEALLFLSPQPVSAADLAEATEATEGQVERGDRAAARGPRRGQARASSCARSPAASRWPATRPARRRRAACWPSRARRR